jgi:hypothetical protein
MQNETLKILFLKIKALFIKTEETYLWPLEAYFICSLEYLRIGRSDFFLHYINFRICQIFFFLNKFFDSKKNNSIKKKYFSFYDERLVNSFLSICNWMKANKKNSSETLVNYSNYSFTTINAFKNQTQFDSIPKSLIKKLEDTIESSGILVECSKIFNCHFRIVQMRSWLWLPKKNEPGLAVGAHYDFLNAGTLKIMFYQGYFEKDNSAIDLFENVTINEWFHRCKKKIGTKGLKRILITGKDLVLVFDSNSILHSAQIPKEIRPTIELTIMPSIRDSNKIIQAGFRANLPYNPYKKCKKLINICRSY